MCLSDGLYHHSIDKETKIQTIHTVKVLNPELGFKPKSSESKPTFLSMGQIENFLLEKTTKAI